MKIDYSSIGNAAAEGGTDFSGEVLEDIGMGFAVAAAENVVNKIGLPKATSKRVKTALHKTKNAKEGVEKVGGTVVGAGAAVTSATSLTVAATSGAGIATALAHAGAVVGGGVAAGPAVLAGGPAYLATRGLNSTVFKEEAGLSTDEADARTAARKATNVGASMGVVGVGAATVAGGASGAAIMGTLATIGGVVGGGAIVGAAVLAAAPVAVAAAAGFGVRAIVRRNRRKTAALDAENAEAQDGRGAERHQS